MSMSSLRFFRSQNFPVSAVFSGERPFAFVTASRFHVDNRDAIVDLYHRNYSIPQKGRP